MLKGLIGRMPTSAKVQVALRALGFSSEEKAALDSLIARYGSSPLGATLFGSSLSNIESLLGLFIDKMVQDGQSLGQDAAPIGRLLAVPQLRGAVTSMVINYVAAQPSAENLFSAINKLASVPGAPWANRDYDTVQSFLEEGLLPVVSDVILSNGGEPQGELIVKGFVRCPDCGFVHGV